MEEELKRKKLEEEVIKYRTSDMMFLMGKHDSSPSTLTQTETQTSSFDSIVSTGIKIVPFKRNSSSGEKNL
jgi:hypothetical protein